ncbi:MAG: hypothetical protein QM775_01675 [Pirellulales bacterium]
MRIFAPEFATRRRLAALCCGLAAAAVVCSLNVLLPPGTSYRFEIGWTLLLFALAVLLVGIGLLCGDRVAAAVTSRWQTWSVRKRVVICATTYVVGGLACHAAVDLYEASRWLLYTYLPRSVSFWFQ